MAEALRLLVEHGNGDVSHDQPTQLVYGVPHVNLRTALALDALGYVMVFERTPGQGWGSIELQDAGRAAYEEGLC